MKKLFFLMLFFSSNAMHHDQIDKSLYFFNTLLNLYNSNDAWDQLIFNELWYKSQNSSHEIWPEQLKEEYYTKLNSLQLIDSDGDPRREVSAIMNSLVIPIKENDNRKYAFINPLQRTVLCKSPELQKQIGTYILLKLLCTKRNRNYGCFKRAILW